MLNWDWKEDKVGYWKEKRNGFEFKYNLYSGNALLIMIAEWEENGQELYQVANFFCDKEHMKNCLGLNKGYENIFAESDEIEISLSGKYRNSIMIAQHFLKANTKNKVTIQIVKEPW